MENSRVDGPGVFREFWAYSPRYKGVPSFRKFLARSWRSMAARAPLPTSVAAAASEIEDIERQISALEQELIVEDSKPDGKDDEVVDEPDDADGGPVDWLPPRMCVPICADVREFDFKVSL